MTFCNVPIFYGTFSVPCPTTMLKDHPLMLIQNTYSIHPDIKQTENGRPLNWNLDCITAFTISQIPREPEHSLIFTFFKQINQWFFWFINLLFCIPQYSFKAGWKLITCQQDSQEPEKLTTLHVSKYTACLYTCPPVCHTAYLHLENGKPSSALPNEAANSI